MSTESSPIACTYCFNFYLIPTGCLEDRRPTVICAQDHMVCAKCALLIKERTLNCPVCQDQILKVTRIDPQRLSVIEKLSYQKNIPLNELILSYKSFAQGAYSDVFDGKWKKLNVAVKV